MLALRPHSDTAGLGRWALALEWGGRWQWGTATGDWKGRAALAVLVQMAQRRWIPLPASTRLRTPGRVRGPKAKGWRSEGIEGPLSQYRPLCWAWVHTAPQRTQWGQLLD